MSITGTSLELTRRPRLAWSVDSSSSCLAIVLALVRSANPEPTCRRPAVIVNASTPVDQPIYVGVFTAGSDFDRTLDLSGVKVHTTSNTDVSVTPLLCRGGTVGVTTDPESFCADLVNPEGAAFGGRRLDRAAGHQRRAGSRRGRPGQARVPRRLPVGHAARGPRRRRARARPMMPATAQIRSMRRSRSSARAAASVISSESMAWVRWNQASASFSRPAATRVSA